MSTVSSDVESAAGVPGGEPEHGWDGPISFGSSPSPWRGGLAAARKHTVRVRIFRGVALAVCLAGGGLVAAGALLAPARKVPESFSAEGVGLDGTKITLESPKISGFQLDRKPYSLKARRGVQDLTRPHVIELLDIDVGIGTTDAKTIRVIASRAQYDTRNEQILLDGNVTITNAGGYELSLQAARVDLAAGTLVSDSPVSLQLDGATVDAQKIVLDNRRHMISFDGGVKSSIRPQSDAAVSAP
jgi:lipopolysaccharide export system protein LptC